MVVLIHTAQIHQNMLQVACFGLCGTALQACLAPGCKFFAQQGVARACEQTAGGRHQAGVIGRGVAEVLIQQQIGGVGAVGQIVDRHQAAARSSLGSQLPLGG